MIYFRDKEYVQDVDILLEKENNKDYSLKKGIEQLQKEYDSYKKEHKDESMKDYVINVFRNLDNYKSTSTDPSTDAEYVQDNGEESVIIQYQQENTQHANNIDANTQQTAVELQKNEACVTVNNNRLTLEQYNFLYN